MAKRYDVKTLAEKLNLVREENLQDDAVEPPPCQCEPIVAGCYCGRFEYEMSLKRQSNDILQSRHTAYFPEAGDVYIINRPPNTTIDYSEIPFRVWAKCEGKRVEVDLVQPDDYDDALWWCWIDVSHITKRSDDEYWFPSDSLVTR